MKDTFAIKDRDTVLHISYDDMIKYHGRFYIGGVALAFKSLEMAFSRLLKNEIPSREKISYLSGLGMNGMGVIDGVEMVTRAWSRGELIADTKLVKDKPGIDAPNGGKYYFEVGYDGRRVGLAVKEGLIPLEFKVLSRKALKGEISDEEAVRLQQVKEELASTLMSNKAEDLFNCVFINQ